MTRLPAFSPLSMGTGGLIGRKPNTCDATIAASTSVEGEMGKAGVARFCLYLPAIVRRKVLDKFQPMYGALDISDFYVRSFDAGNLSDEGGVARCA